VRLRRRAVRLNRGAARVRAAAFLTRPAFTLAVILVTTALMVRFGGIGYLAGLAVALLVLFTMFMWVAAACGEEFFYRGYVMKQLAELLGDSPRSWVAAIFLSAIPFGLVHLYQGWSGVVTTGAMGVVLGTAFFLNRRNLAVCILAHGIYDMVGLTLIYLGQGDALQRIGNG